MGRRNLCAFLCVTLMMIVDVNAGILHRVGGGRYTWNPKVNFSDWASRERFYSGDWLLNKSSYEQCINIDFISNVTRGGRDVFQLFQPKPYYFICGRGYCHQGMKLTVNVLPKPAPSTPTAIITPASTTTTLIPSNAFAAVTMAILTFAFKTSYFN
ncbi:hypothetical protein Bca52824_051021 [Brassica carinata]|uniref:Phytocyanin domain-containing protein n=2 Tax=Brassica TaxID=3705 RepID=A0A8S9QI20_BRACR|nr:hypothetical protein F2Q69_00018980 [Brassica cretica]KAG2279801.1 hypothetical protein Bca52824_051021 [Brassica carinata]